MQFVRRAGSDPAFLLKAMREASGEMRELFYGLRRGELLRPADAPDDGWSLLGIAYHLRAVEEGVARQVDAMVSYREPEIPNVDLDDIPMWEDYEHEDDDALLDGFHYYRRRNTYVLWDLDTHDWERGGIHPYRGRVTLMELAREMYQHDLEHLWQARRIVESFGRHRH